MNVTKIREFSVFWADKVGEGPPTYSMVLGELFLNDCWVKDLRKNSRKKKIKKKEKEKTTQKMWNQNKNTALNFSPKIKISKQRHTLATIYVKKSYELYLTESTII